MLIFPVLPAFRIDGGGAGGTEDKGSADDGKGGTDDDKTKDNKDDKKDEKLFNQADLDSIIGKRLAKDRKSWEKEKADEIEAAKLSETDRLKKEKADAEKKGEEVLKTANSRLVKAEVITKAVALKIIDPDAAYALMDRTDVDVSDDGTVSGIDVSLQKLIKDKPYLVGDKVVTRTGDDQHDDKEKKPTGAMNDLIRRAAGRG